MGIHLGYTSRVRDPKSGRFEFSGPAVQVATELAMHAEGGHVLVSREVTAATDGASSADSGKPPSGRYVSLGVLEVNGKNGGSSTDVEIFEMRVSGLEERVGGLVGGHATTSSGHGTTSGSSTDITGRPLRTPLPMSDMYIGSSNACRWIIPYEELAMTKVDVGQGSYGVVSKARWKGIEVAVKRFIKQRLDEDTMLRFREEAAMMAELRHPNVVLFIGACVRSPNMCIITEWIPKGSLRDVLTNHSVKFPWPTRLRVLHGIVLGLSYLHSQSPPIMHRDLKSSNVLVDESWNAKIADFGFARIKEENVTMTKCGTPAWIAPEVVRREHYTEKADIYRCFPTPHTYILYTHARTHTHHTHLTHTRTTRVMS
jgi:tRNA A-37 threonylcarbamoyl transferase component Bud32